MIEAMAVEVNGEEKTPIGLHPELDSKEKEDGLDQHKYVPEQMIQYGMASESNVTQDNGVKRNFVSSLDTYWNKGIIPYTLDGILGVGKNKDIILGAIAELARKTCIRLVPKESSEAQGLGHNTYIEFFSGSGCWSYVGRVFNEKQQISLGSGCMSHGTVLHEILHAIGTRHEQSREDRDDHINILTNNIIETQVRNFDKSMTADTNPYDAESIMQYNLYSFGKVLNGKKLKTMELLDRRLEFLTDENAGMDFYDVADITDGYQCAARCVGSFRPLCQNGGFVDFNCKCFCPNGVMGDNCELVDTPTDCGGIVDVASKVVTTISTPNWPSAYKAGTKCTWVLRAPVGEVLKIRIDNLDLPFNSKTNVCYHWLEIRYNLIGQLGPKRCGQINGETWVATTDGNSNLMMLKFDALFASDKAPGRGFTLRATTIGRGCADHPCRTGRCTADDDGVYTCSCPVGITGAQCNLVSATGSVACTFEHDQNCFLKEDPTGSLWAESSAETPSKGTGPSGPKEGVFYWYAETSAPAQMGDTFRLVSDISFSDDTARCLSFYYSMNGKDVGSLQVYRQVGESENGIIFRKVGDRGGDWQFGEVTIEPAVGVKIIIEAVCGKGWMGDIGIDDIHLVPGKCSSAASSLPPGQKECDFEPDDLTPCFFDMSTGTNEWTLLQGKTPSANTGPSRAYRGGFYAYLEASFRSEGTTAAMTYQFPSKDANQVHCLSFAYHMWGKTMGYLTVELKTNNVMKEELWEIGGEDQGDVWTMAYITIRAAQQKMITITATRGKNWQSDIAIDDIILRNGSC